MGMKRCFTYYWQIKNFSFAWQGCILSPEFFVDIMDNTLWKLCVVIRPTLFKDCITCHLIRGCAGSDDFSTYALEYRLEYLDGDGFSLLSKGFSRTPFEKNSPDYDSAVKRDEVLVLKNYCSLPGDTLTVVCKMWNGLRLFKEEGRCFAVTRIKVEKTSCVGVVEDFSHLEPNLKRAVRIKSASRDRYFTSVNISLSEVGKICVEIVPIYNEFTKVFKCTVILWDFQNRQLECCKNEFERPATKSEGTSEQTLKFQLIHTSSDLLRIFHDSTFYIQCEMEYSTEIDYDRIEKTEFARSEFPSEAISNLKNIDSVSADKQLNYLKNDRLDCLKDDLTSFYQNGILCDMEIKTRAESFHTHSLLLRARSPVFHNYLSNDFGRSIRFVDLDLEPDIVRQMLTFLYSDSLEDLDLESARILYFVAISYQIPSLKRGCSLFLLRNLQLSNCCDTLLLADKHQDRNMKAMVQDYIHQHHEEIYSSKEWSNFVKSNSMLAAETMCLKYKRR